MPEIASHQIPTQIATAPAASRRCSRSPLQTLELSALRRHESVHRRASVPVLSLSASQPKQKASHEGALCFCGHVVTIINSRDQGSALGYAAAYKSKRCSGLLG